MGLHFGIYQNRRSMAGTPVWAFGLRIGYWPCIRGYFIALAAGPVSVDLWYEPPLKRKPITELWPQYMLAVVMLFLLACCTY